MALAAPEIRLIRQILEVSSVTLRDAERVVLDKICVICGNVTVNVLIC